MPLIKVGVLALQGGFAKHMEMLKSLDVIAQEVRTERELLECDGLIIPGGESPVILSHLQKRGFWDCLHDFGKKRPIFGTCAGLILMAQRILKDKMKPFGFIDIDVERNSYGTQINSFQTDVLIKLSGLKNRHYPALFIRSPRIKRVGLEVQVLASHEQDPILVRQTHHLAATFHPELTKDGLIHRYFIQMIQEWNC